MLDASTTVNPFPSPELLSLLGRELALSRSYPEPWAAECREAISARHLLSPDRIVAGPGATFLLYHLLGTASFRRLLLPEPVFSEYGRAAEAVGLPVLRIPPGLDLRLSGGLPLRWGIDLDRAGGLIRPGDLLVLVNPVNPTGQEFSASRLLDLSRRIGAAGGALLADESFQDFLDNRSSVLSRAGEEGLIVLRSLTKITGLPGIRAGFLAGPPEIAGRMRAALGPWSAGHLEQAVIRWAMGRRKASEFGWSDRVRDRLRAGLEALGVATLHGEGPMILAAPGFGADEGRSFRLRLGEKGVRIRLAEGFGPPEGARLVRVGFEAFSDADRFLELWRSTFSGASGRFPA
ncbi:MAG: aminotransferase class I/II-fold pyridoxal phosphate-dependent enzyme [Nitrospirae bacterium]|nr:aminotransferase class I/II-fold pyridoxal phosphate-dependent enzyme [Nitrospirota bacterium]